MITKPANQGNTGRNCDARRTVFKIELRKQMPGNQQNDRN